MCLVYGAIHNLGFPFPIALQFVLELCGYIFRLSLVVHWQERLHNTSSNSVDNNIQSLNLVAAAVSTVKEVDECPNNLVQFRY